MNDCCPLNSKVLSSRSARGGATIKRRRECEKCGYRFTTFEHLREEPPILLTYKEVLVHARRHLLEISNRSAKVDDLLSSLDPEVTKHIAKPQIPVEELSLSLRSYNCLKRAGINCVSHLVEYTHEELLNIRNFGSKSADEVSEALRLIGITLPSTKTPLS